MKGKLKYMQYIVWVLILGYSLTLLMIIYRGNDYLLESYDDIDYILVLGAKLNEDGPSTALKYRLDTTLGFVRQHSLKVPIIVSGAQGADEPMAEAQGMKDYLVLQGIPASQILMEPKATSTVTNLLYTKEMMPSAQNVLIVTNGFHIARTRYLVKKHGLNAYYLKAPTNRDVYGLKSFMREPFAFVKAIIFD